MSDHVVRPRDDEREARWWPLVGAAALGASAVLTVGAAVAVVGWRVIGGGVAAIVVGLGLIAMVDGLLHVGDDL